MEIRISIFWTNTKISVDLYRERQRTVSYTHLDEVITYVLSGGSNSDAEDVTDENASEAESDAESALSLIHI